MQTKNKRIITIKREIYVDKRLNKFLRRNMEYSRKLYNKAVEIVRSNNDRCDKYELDTYIHNNIEINDINYHKYAVGIRSSVCSRVNEATKTIWKNRKKGIRSDLRFKRYNPYSGSLKVENKHRNTCKVIDSNTVKYKANKTKDSNGNHLYHFDISLKEPIYYYKDNKERIYDKNKRYRFSNSDIKEIGFVKDINKYYIIIIAEVTFNLYNGIDKSRKPLAGIDLGIHNPITLYNGSNIDVRKFNSDILRKLKHLENRASKLQSIMDRKMSRNIERGSSPYSKNYEKVRKKYRKTWRKIYNIRHNWRFNEAYNIVNSFDRIVVDEFKQPKDLIKHEYLKQINHGNRLHAMYLFTECLKYMAQKYLCRYIESPKYTTRTCHKCGYVNEKLNLNQRKLTCNKCGLTIDRDINAALNCYNSIIRVVI